MLNETFLYIDASIRKLLDVDTGIMENIQVNFSTSLKVWKLRQIKYSIN